MDGTRARRGITITSAATTCYWKNNLINIIDTPGHVDFTVEVERSLRVLDGVVAVFCAVAGVQPQSETVWRQADRYNVPRIAFVNKMDRVGADYDQCLKMMEKIYADTVVINYPIRRDNFQGIIDIIHGKEIIYDTNLGEKYEERDISPENKDKYDMYRELLLEKAAEANDEYIEKFLETGSLSDEEIIEGIRTLTNKKGLVPVCCGTAFKNSVQPLLDYIGYFLPSPLDAPPVEGESKDTGEIEVRTAKEGEPFSALAFKIQTDPFVGKLTYVRVYSGTVDAGSYVWNSVTGKKEELGVYCKCMLTLVLKLKVRLQVILLVLLD